MGGHCRIARAAQPRDRLASPKQPFDVGKVERDVGRATVIALAAVRSGFHLTQQCVHFGGREMSSSAHAGMASERAAYGFDPLFKRQAVAPLGELVGEV